MSTILKALRRLEQEKIPKERPLREQVTRLDDDDRIDPGTPRRWPILLAGIGAGVAAGLAVLLLVLARGDSPLPSAYTAHAPALAESLPQPSAAQPLRRESPAHAAPAPAAVPAATPPPVASDDVEVIDRGLPAPRVIAPERAEAAVAPAVPAEPPPGSVRPFQHAERRARKTPPPPAPAPAIAAEQPARRAAPPPAISAEPQTRPTAPAPAIAAKPPARQPAPPPDPFPALRVERTTWHPLAERRLAVVDVPGEGTRELREGDPVAGATVSLIEPSGVVFRHAGREVRRKVGGGS
jgi:hypothetical protein